MIYATKTDIATLTLTINDEAINLLEADMTEFEMSTDYQESRWSVYGQFDSKGIITGRETTGTIRLKTQLDTDKILKNIKAIFGSDDPTGMINNAKLAFALKTSDGKEAFAFTDALVNIKVMFPTFPIDDVSETTIEFSVNGKLPFAQS